MHDAFSLLVVFYLLYNNYWLFARSSGDNIEHEEDWQPILYTAFSFIMLLHILDEFYTITTVSDRH